MTFSRSVLILALTSALGLPGITTASAATWTQKHPRRIEVNHRLANQDRRINRGFAEGKINANEAARLHRNDRIIRADERLDARFDYSHLTRTHQRSLNQYENGVSRQIYHDAH